MVAKFLKSNRSLAVGYAVSLGALITFAMWIFLDSVFHWIFRETSASIYPRRAAFAVLAAIAIAATTFVIARLFFGSLFGRSLKAYFFVVTMVALWLSLLGSHERLAWSGVMWKVHRLLPGLKADAQYLANYWPAENGELPFLGPFTVYNWGGERAIELTRWKPQLYTHILIGPSIERENGRSITFDVDRMGWIVYRPFEGLPVDPKVAVVEYQSWNHSFKIIELEPEWYLVWQSGVLPQTPAQIATHRFESETQLYKRQNNR
jgi:hypothetical protein